MDTVHIAVVGAGVIGLSTAMCISQLVPRSSITVISDKFTPDTTSNVAAGMLIPHKYPGERWVYFQDADFYTRCLSWDHCSESPCLYQAFGSDPEGCLVSLDIFKGGALSESSSIHRCLCSLCGSVTWCPALLCFSAVARRRLCSAPQTSS